MLAEEQFMRVDVHSLDVFYVFQMVRLFFCSDDLSSPSIK